MLDATHDPKRRSWVAGANSSGADFPIQNLPFGRFRRAVGDKSWRIGVAIGDQVLDLKLAADGGSWDADVKPLLAPLAEGDLNGFMAQGAPARRRLRSALSEGLAEGSARQAALEPCLLPIAKVELGLPCAIGDYTDFYAGIHHATTVGKLMRPDNPLLPNYKWVPIGYHGRASSIGVSGQRIRRPQGQTRGEGDTPAFGPSRRMDYELELGALIGEANPLGEPVPMASADERIFGIVLLNDWSARDIQGWEYQPLGPFLAKNFATSISPWVVTNEALAPFRAPFTRPAGDPQPLPYLDSDFNRKNGVFEITLEVWLRTENMRSQNTAAVRLSQCNFRDAYWTLAQLVAHHSSNGCNLQPGDLLGSGTQSGPVHTQGGSLLELTLGGKQPITLPNGEKRSFLEDGDTVTLRGYCEKPGAARIGLGEVSGTITG